MKYFTLTQIQESLERLKRHHPIFASTFFVLKKAKVPIGRKVSFSLNSENHEFFREHYRVHPKSDMFLHVFRNRSPEKDWLVSDYPSKALQQLNRNAAFLHDRNSNYWGFSDNYILELEKLLPKNQRIPLFHVAVWFYKYNQWEDNISREDIIKYFISDFNITDAEIDSLFDIRLIPEIEEKDTFQSVKAKWQQIVEPYSTPDDVPPEQSGILHYLEVEGVGPVTSLIFEPAQRLNIIMGDNGLGKTFLLDLSWSALTQNLAELAAKPFKIGQKKTPFIRFVVSGSSESKPTTVKFSNKSLSWEKHDKISSVSGLGIYARVDGSFAIWDPVNRILSGKSTSDLRPSVVFSSEQVWNGIGGQIEGLLRDWIRWQERRDKYPVFDTFSKVLQKLSPPDLPLVIGEPTRILGDARDIPTFIHPYGNVPVVFESAGIKRILTIAYLIVWAWEEHKIQAKQMDIKEERQMVILLDEAEAHLHPKWQRKIIPALLDIAKDIHSELSLQIIAATHSPLVMASCEPIFDPETDTVFHLDLTESGKVLLTPRIFEVRGTVDSWLSSDFFGLKFPGNEKRSYVIQRAISLQLSDSATKEQVEEISDQLKELLPAEDSFWIRWIIYAEQFGVQI